MIPDDQLKPLPEDLDGVVSVLKRFISQGERNALDYQKRFYNGVMEKAVVYCLEHGVDLAKGCLAAAIAKLPDSLTTLTRALIETFIWSRYVTLTKDNAQKFADETLQEMARIARKNLKSGTARIVKNATQEDATKKFLNSPKLKNIPPRLRIENAAKDSGLDRLYTQIYGFASIYAHGKAFGMHPEEDIDRRLYSELCAALGTFECINLIASEWIVNRRVTPLKMLNNLIGYE